MTIELLTANRTYYVSTTGNDSNDGLSAITPFLTMQRAADVIQRTLHLGGEFTVTVLVAAGTYSSGVKISGDIIGATGPSSLVFQADGAVVINSSAHGFYAMYGAMFTVTGDFTITAATFAFIAIFRGHIHVSGGAVTFGAGLIHVYANRYGYIEIAGNYNISGAADHHIQSSHHGNVRIQGGTCTMLNNLTFPTCYAYSLANSDICYTNNAAINTNGKTITGKRYMVSSCSNIQWAGGNQNSLPGSVAGTEDTNGKYII